MKSLKPTYKLMIGIPGSSNAFAIAKQLGMPDDITEAARDGMDENQINMERIIEGLEENEREMSRLRAELEIETKSAEQLRKRLADKEKTLDEKKSEILENARSEARDIVEEAKDLMLESLKIQEPDFARKRILTARKNQKKQLRFQDRKQKISI